MKTLKMQPLRDAYYIPIEQDLLKIFREIMFEPILAIIKDNTTQKIVLNANTTALEQALKSGRIQYNAELGEFSGQFSAAISKALRDIGARFDSRYNLYYIESARLPDNIRQIASQSAAFARSSHDSMLKALDDAHQRIEAAQTKFEVNADGMIERVSADFKDVAKAVTVTPTLTEPAKAALAADYNKNMDLYIKGWCNEQIEKLRDQVEQNARTGYRFDSLIDRIEHEYGTSHSKAKFLARQETALFMSKFRRENFQQMGVFGYIWHARGKGLTRPNHWVLHNRVFLYSEPPVVDPARQRRANPGEDFNCLCADRAILGVITPEMIGKVRTAA